MLRFIKLTIFTGKEDFDVVELGVYSEFTEGVLNKGISPHLGIPGSDVVFYDLDGMKALNVLYIIINIIGDIESNHERFNDFKTEELFSAKAYLTSLRAACEAHPACKVNIVSL